MCGVAGVEGEGRFTFRKIARSTFYMYPEEALGSRVQSASIMWEQIERLFNNIRKHRDEKEWKCPIGITINGVDSWMYEFCRGHCMY